VTGGRVTGGNAYNGTSGSAAWLRGESGGVARVNDDLYAARDGTVYKRTDGGWQANSGNGWSNVQPPEGARDQASQRAQQNSGQQRGDFNRQQGTTQPSLRESGGQSSRVSADQWSSLNRQSTSRDFGQARTNNYRSGSYRSAGGMGGGRRGRR
jgi:hypothetical protein